MGGISRRKALLTKRRIKASHTFAIKHVDDSQDFWEKKFFGLTKQKRNFWEGVCLFCSRKVHL